MNQGYVVKAKTDEGKDVFLWDYASEFKSGVQEKLYYRCLEERIAPSFQEQRLKELGWEIVKFQFIVVSE